MNNKNIIFQPSYKRSVEEAIATDYDFAMGDIIAKSFAATYGLKLKVFYGLLIYLVIYFIFAMIHSLLFGSDEKIAYQLFRTLCFIIVLTAFLAMSLNWLRGANTKLADLFSGFKILLPILLSTIAIFVLVLLGTALLLIPGLYLAISYVFVYYIILDNPNIKIWDAMEASRKIVHKHWFKIFALNLIFVLIILASIIPSFLSIMLWKVFAPLFDNWPTISLIFLVLLISLFLVFILVFPALLLAYGIIYQKIFDITEYTDIVNDEVYKSKISY